MVPTSLSRRDLLVLNELHIHDQFWSNSLTIDELAAALTAADIVISTRYIARALGSLFDLGYVQRTSSGGDNRKWKITDTGSGYAVGNTEISGKSDGAPETALSLDATSTVEPSAHTTLGSVGTLGGAALAELALAEDGGIPAADRYVSVRDNQSSFDEISRSLTVIKNEFAEDHYKQTNTINTPAVIAEIEAFEHQIRSGWVGRPAAQNFLETLRYIESVCVSSSKIVGAIAAIAASLKIIFGFVL